ncbi:glucose-1-phosphate adenylyltransferase subunit GlgD [Clostridium formicaceticum]|uniref:Glucose-1-phosphate adenylyltransferase subunit GlgD n=1 Tax=Clostridium formicaceticum TaxID=1497 RepID=A0AAC9RPF3_9CLOT|nr:glucose-1-phosphate adenylyltransferase subunit GlgD [Clostridium formicaceticum]AOY74893.1 glucose-1-phosphate adenylyltransferase subunit GlgD [Clostridium formicaceticum]ARE89297.1 Glycogen biosynthesis protein GlgD [Clostridium formicaceticum]
MENVMGLINDVKVKRDLKEIVKQRSTAAVPFGGRYRMVDFVLSNMTNCGIKNIGIFTQHNSRSLIGHVHTGKDWGLCSKKDGLFILPPVFQEGYSHKNTGDIHHFYSHVDYLRRSKQDYILISSSNMLYKLNYKKIKEYYERKNADIVILYKNYRENLKSSRFLALKVNQQNRITDITINKRKSINDAIALETAFMKKSLFLEIIEDCILKGYSNFVKDGIIKNIYKYSMYGYPYEGYAANIDCVGSYYQHSMDLLTSEVWKELFLKEGPIRTRINDEAPAKYTKTCEVKNSLVTEGCIIEGKVINSILFRGVKVHKNAVIRNSIVMQKNEIEENAIVENAILDKGVRITAGKVIKGEEKRPILIGKTQVI